MKKFLVLIWKFCRYLFWSQRRAKESVAYSIATAFDLIKKEFEENEMDSLVDVFLAKADYSTKWVLYSDYCLDDDKKPNDVITFVLVPYLGEEKYHEMDTTIHETQPKDIKKARSVSDDFMEYIKQQSVFSYSFIVKDRKKLFGKTHEERIESVTGLLNEVKRGIGIWKRNATGMEPIDYYDGLIKKLDRLIKEITPKKNIKEHMDILLITLLGAFCTAQILKKCPKLEVIGWFPDRDAINEACDKIAFPLFYVFLYNHIGGTQYQQTMPKPDNTVVPFYDNFNRIADVICGTIADYDMKNNVVSKEKFSEVLRGLIADNMFIRTYRLSVNDENVNLGTIQISMKPFENNRGESGEE